MMNGKRLGTAALAFALVIGCASLALADSSVTVGQFVQRLARTMNLNATDVDTAVDSLERAGVQLPGSLRYSSALTEGDVTRIGRAAGLSLRTGNPEANFDQDNVDRFFVSFGEEFAAVSRGTTSESSANSTPFFDPFNPLIRFRDDEDANEGTGKGKGKGKGKGGRTPTDPD